ncbi:MAG TPA: c-type cytochrome [Acidobacteriaceae bacterium]|nr:c-type cytochrome [Acidobacteriaceae bacterium]
MRKFLLGFIVAIVTVFLAGFCFVRFGGIDPRADVPVNGVEQKLAMPSLDAALDRRAPEIDNPVEATSANLITGMRLYQTNCSSCHGDIHQPHGMLANALYPRAPQFMEDAPDMPENQNFYIIQHGIRLSGMPSWKQTLSDQQMWQVTTFLSYMDKLPPDVTTEWKTLAGGVGDMLPVAPPSSRNDNMQGMRMK